MTITTARRRRSALLFAMAVSVGACASEGRSDTNGADRTDDRADATDASSPVIEVEQIEPTPPDVKVSGLAIAQGGSGDGVPAPLVGLDELRSGGPPPDGIPSIDEPSFVAAGTVEFVGDNEPVLALDIDGDVRAYPVQILMWHEIVNDTVAGVPVAVTYCPLCNSAVAYDRRVGERVVEFGTSGMLWNSALVMYDRQTETLWSHFTGQAIVGELAGTELETFPVATVPFGVWRQANPDGLVLSRETGFDRDYGENPYPGYDDITSEPFLFEGTVDGRFTAMTRFVGITLDDDALGVPMTVLRERRVVSSEIGGVGIVVFWAPGTASALDATEIVDGVDVGATGVFRSSVDGRELTFSASSDGFVDDQTGTSWNLLGRATAGPLIGTTLERVEHVDTFWFAWSTFRPDSALVVG